MSSSSNGDKGEIRLNNVLDAIRDGTQKQRTDGLRDLKAIFEKTSRAANMYVSVQFELDQPAHSIPSDLLKDKAYHSIFEVVFKVALVEKQSFLSAKKTTTTQALTRITNCADVVRVIVRAGTPKLRVKTVHAVVDHIMQTLPNANGEYCQPLSLHYLRALTSLLEHKSHVEHLKRDKWIDIVDFCLEGLERYLEETEGQPSGLARSSSDLGQLVKSARNASQSQIGTVSRRNAEDLLQCLQFLVSAPNSPVHERAKEITDCVLIFLRAQNLTVSQAHQLAFSILNAIISYTYVDCISLSEMIAQEVVPIIHRVWQGKTVAKDEMLNSVKDEMLILLLSVHLHLERCVRDAETSDISSALRNLLKVMRMEYAKRSGRDRLLLEDVEMIDLDAKRNYDSPSRLNVFQLKPHNIRAERNWSILQVIGILEYLVSLAGIEARAEESDDDADDPQPSRKRQRLTRHSDHPVDFLKSDDENVCSASLQILPFILQSCQLPCSILTELIGRLIGLVADKRAQIDSWALLGIARQVPWHISPLITTDRYVLSVAHIRSP
ncbi:ataxia telangiectasia mutated [Phlyctema vagabunda]|uniref:Ataxia telangiectasia mutated n=1 Tax=Phlyctema vagabunda TaxID=108571 RepID=A0ABR4PIW2_9HELO